MRGRALAGLGWAALGLGLAGCLTPHAATYHEIRQSYTPPPATEPVGAAPTAIPAGPLALPQAVGLALRNNPDREMALFRIRQAEAMVDQALAPFYPLLSLGGEYLRGDAPSAYLFRTIDQRALAANTDFNRPGSFQNYELGLTGRMNLFNGGGDLLRRRLAETGLTLSQLDRQGLDNALVASVAKAFYNCLATADFITVAEQSAETVSAELKVMRVRYEAGGVLKSDVLSLEVRLAQARESLVTTRNQHRLALAALANLMGGDLDAVFTPTAGEGLGVTLPAEYREGLGLALEARPELKKARRQVEQAHLGLKAAQSEYWPRLDAQARLYLDGEEPSDLRGDKANWTAGLLANWDLFSGFATQAGERKAAAQLGEMLAADRKTAQMVQLDVKSAYLNQAEAAARREVSQAAVGQAEESLRLVRRQYEGGAADITRYLDAELALTRARIQAIAARHDCAKAQADLGRALGLFARGPAAGR